MVTLLFGPALQDWLSGPCTASSPSRNLVTAPQLSIVLLNGENVLLICFLNTLMETLN